MVMPVTRMVRKVADLELSGIGSSLGLLHYLEDPIQGSS
jgi:hypothetical protein